MSLFFFFSSRRRHTRWNCDWSSDVCSSDLPRLDLANPRLVDRSVPGPHVGDDFVEPVHLELELDGLGHVRRDRSEERRVGKVWRSRWSGWLYIKPIKSCSITSSVI